MILAGIDEAGYGPILGPLVVGCAAFELPDDGTDAIPDAWKLLRRAVGKTRDLTGKRLHVNDSKKVYTPSIGLAELERAVLCLAATRHGEMIDLAAMLCACAPESCGGLLAHDWYRPGEGERFPLEHDPLAIRLAANSTRHELSRVGVRVAHLHAHVVGESRLNEMFAATRNKGATSFTFVAQHLDALLHTFADQRLVIYCDRQGGREHYGGLLRQMFEAWSLEVVVETPARSKYRLTSGERSATLIFAEEAEQQCIAVALASMLSKYLREATMRRFNAYWRTHAPDIKPTAGYWTDGLRFVKDLEPTLARLGIEAGRLMRER